METTIRTFPLLPIRLGARTCLWLAPLWVTLHTARGADLGDLARKYYDVAKVAVFGPPDGPHPGGQSMGVGGQSGNSLDLRLITDFFEKGMILKGPSTCQKLLYEPEIQTCTWLAPLWVTLRTTRGAGFG